MRTLDTSSDNLARMRQWCSVFEERGIKPTGDDGLMLVHDFVAIADELERTRSQLAAMNRLSSKAIVDAVWAHFKGADGRFELVDGVAALMVAVALARGDSGYGYIFRAADSTPAEDSYGHDDLVADMDCMMAGPYSRAEDARLRVLRHIDRMKREIFRLEAQVARVMTDPDYVDAEEKNAGFQRTCDIAWVYVRDANSIADEAGHKAKERDFCHFVEGADTALGSNVFSAVCADMTRRTAALGYDERDRILNGFLPPSLRGKKFLDKLMSS